MCRLLGYASAHPCTTESILGGTQSAVFQDMAVLHKDGWGNVRLDDSTQPATLKAVRSPESGIHDEQLTDVLTGQASRAQITHLRMATDGMACEPQNTHPFVANGLAFAHNGGLAPLELLEQRIAPEVAAQLMGDTDSERYFAVIRTAVARNAAASGLGLVDAVQAAVHELRPLFPHASMNALLLSPTHLIAIHANQGAKIPNEDFDASGLSEAELPMDHRTAYYLMRQKRLDDGTIVFASSGLDIIGWEPLAPETIVSVDLHTLESETRAIADEPRTADAARSVA